MALRKHDLGGGVGIREAPHEDNTAEDDDEERYLYSNAHLSAFSPHSLAGLGLGSVEGLDVAAGLFGLGDDGVVYGDTDVLDDDNNVGMTPGETTLSATPTNERMLQGSVVTGAYATDGVGSLGRSARITFPGQAKPPKIVHNYLLGSVLGEGTYGKVREAVHLLTMRRVAIKICKLRKLRKHKNALRNIESEIQIMQYLTEKQRSCNQPYCLSLLEVIRTNERVYLVLELALGPLQSIIDCQPSRSLPVEVVQGVFKQLMLGLQFLHSNGVMHKDIKPSNVMVMPDGCVCISDFGVAEQLPLYQGDDLCPHTHGSPAFQSPQIAAGSAKVHGAKADVWAAGVTLYAMLTGRMPFAAEGLISLYDCILHDDFSRDGVPAECLSLLDGMLEKDEDARFDVRDVLQHPWVHQADMIPRETPYVVWCFSGPLDPEESDTAEDETVSTEPSLLAAAGTTNRLSPALRRSASGRTAASDDLIENRTGSGTAQTIERSNSASSLGLNPYLAAVGTPSRDNSSLGPSGTVYSSSNMETSRGGGGISSALYRSGSSSLKPSGGGPTGRPPLPPFYNAKANLRRSTENLHVPATWTHTESSFTESLMSTSTSFTQLGTSLDMPFALSCSQPSGPRLTHHFVAGIAAENNRSMTEQYVRDLAEAHRKGSSSGCTRYPREELLERAPPPSVRALNFVLCPDCAAQNARQHLVYLRRALEQLDPSAAAEASPLAAKPRVGALPNGSGHHGSDNQREPFPKSAAVTYAPVTSSGVLQQQQQPPPPPPPPQSTPVAYVSHAPSGGSTGLSSPQRTQPQAPAYPAGPPSTAGSDDQTGPKRDKCIVM
eukprot:TRINITY_DN4302_c1_g2_i1.p1 TRINITY_DN4302_c1_g2~~TRINITY_DN4302_c1_g2_i1.p1  ORF type:complete len:832 (-),score=144.14 TRINITY_DN4302_c1_g2_i1:280-2775(-)